MTKDYERKFAKIVAANLRALAYDHDKTQADIARDLGIHKATISAWMNGTRTPRMDKIDMLCEYFGCTRMDIMEEGRYKKKDTSAAPVQKNEQPEVYYLDDNAREIAEFYHKNPEYRVLLDASRRISPEDIDFVRQFLEKFGGDE